MFEGTIVCFAVAVQRWIGESAKWECSEGAQARPGEVSQVGLSGTAGSSCVRLLQ